jgi:hypothetical protein
MTLSMEKQIMIHPSQRPCNINDTYDWEGGLTNGNEKRLYHVVLELWHVRKINYSRIRIPTQSICNNGAT